MKNKIFLIALIILLILLIFGSYYWINRNDKKSIVFTNNPEDYVAKIKGAISFPGSYSFKKGDTLREILAKAELKYEAELKNINLDEIKNENFEIYIPFLDGFSPKIKYSYLNDEAELINYGLPNKIAKIIFKYKESNRGVPTWDEIDLIPGIGPRALEQIKKVLILE
ncbi:MAG: MAG0490 family ComEA-like DNA-binding protein [Metamycoplasmataceae bacterium]